MALSLFYLQKQTSKYCIGLFFSLFLLLWQIHLCLCWWTCFFFPLFSFGARYFYQLHGVSFCISASVSLSMLLSAFWHFFFYLQINQNQKYLYLNKTRRCLNVAGIVPCDTSNHQPFPQTHPSIRHCVQHHGFVCLFRVKGQEMDELWRWKGIQATWQRLHWSLSPLCLSLSPSVCPSVPALSKRRLSHHKGHSEHTHTHIYTEKKERKKHTLFWLDKWTLGDEWGSSGRFNRPVQWK